MLTTIHIPTVEMTHDLEWNTAETQAVDAVENAEVAEIERAATVKQFDTIARLEIPAIDAYTMHSTTLARTRLNLLLEECSCGNGSPQNVLVPDIADLADKHNVFIADNDFKSGQTKMKSALLQAKVYRLTQPPWQQRRPQLN